MMLKKILKRLFDIIFSLFAIVIFSPLDRPGASGEGALCRVFNPPRLASDGSADGKRVEGVCTLRLGATTVQPA